MKNDSVFSQFNRNHTVYINCSYNKEFKDLRHQLTLAVIASGHTAISDFDCPDPPTLHLPGLYENISKARYSVHDCSCCTGENPNEYGRYNLPVGLGMSFFERARTSSDPKNHEILILIKNDHSYIPFIRTLAPGELIRYDKKQQAMFDVFSWLSKKKPNDLKFNFSEVLSIWEEFIVERLKHETLNNNFQNNISQEDVQKLLSKLCRKLGWWKDPAKYKYDVFISYNSKDREDIKSLLKLLEPKGITLWIDNKRLCGGSTIPKEIEEGIKYSKSATICFGKHGIGKWQDAEIQALMMNSNSVEHKEQDITLIPILLPGTDEKMANIPILLKSRKWIQFKNFTDKNALQELIDGIQC